MEHKHIFEQHRELKVTQAKFNSLRQEAEPILKQIGKELASSLATAKKEHNFNSNRYYDDWITSYHKILIEFDEDKINIEFWENGCRGDMDEHLYTIEVTEELLTLEGREAYVARWIEEQKLMQYDAARNKKQENLEKIKRLEAEIKQLSTN